MTVSRLTSLSYRVYKKCVVYLEPRVVIELIMKVSVGLELAN